MIARILSLAMAMLVVSPNAVAASFFESGLTYQWQQSDIRNPAPYGESTAKMEGFGLFFRWAYRINESFFAGADLHYHFPRYKDAAVGYNTSTSNFDLGPTIGTVLPWGQVHLWSTYIALAEIDPVGNQNLNYRFLNATGWRVGVGVPVYMTVVSLQYQSIDFRKTRFENSAQFGTSNTDGVRFNGGGWIFGVSLPY